MHILFEPSQLASLALNWQGELKCLLNSSTICSHFAVSCVDLAAESFVNLPETAEGQQVCQWVIFNTKYVVILASKKFHSKHILGAQVN